MKKINNTELEEQIINLYNLNKSLKTISKEINISTSYISRILQDKGIYKYENGKKSNPERNWKLNDDSLEWVAKCKKTNKTFKDFQNRAGFLTRHIIELYPKLEIPKGFKKRQQEKKTGKFWFEEYFNIIQQKKEIQNLKKCNYCNWSTKDINNKSGAFTSHLIDVHNISVLNHIVNYPQDKILFKTYLNKLIYSNNLESDKLNYISCKICNKKLSSITNTHLKTHNINLFEYKMKYPYDEYHSKSFIKKTTENLKNQQSIAIKKFISKPEQELADFLKNLNIEIEQTNRKLLSGIELDIVIENHKLCIEFNGCKYHTELFGKKDKQFHLSKTILSNYKNYGLIHIFEDEWYNKNKIVLDKLKHILKLNNGIKIFARKCTIKNVDSTIKNLFLEQNHIQGNDNSNIYIGGYYNDELIAIMTFDNFRTMNSGNKNKNEYELKRYCTKLNYNCVGMGSKLLKHFIKNYRPSKIISFADRRWTINKENNLYTKMGFVLTKTLSPDYTYYNNKINRLKRFHKFGFGKNQLKNRFPNIYSNNKTEWEIMQEAGYDRIWDCGKWKYELNLTKLF